MKRLKHRPLVILVLLVIFATIIPFSFEVWNLYSIQSAVNEAAHETIRFAASGLSMPEDCTPAILDRALDLLVNDYHLPVIQEVVPGGLRPVSLTLPALTALYQANGVACSLRHSNLLAHTDEILSHAFEQSDRYTSIRRIAAQSLPAQLNPDRVRLTLCSDDLGYQFDVNNATCRPHETAGEPCGTVYARVTYTYPLGSAFGLNLGETLLHSEAKGTVEWFGNSRTGGCEDALFVILAGATPSEYSISVTAPDGNEEHVTCQRSVSTTDPTRESARCPASCNSLGATFYIGHVTEAQITVKWESDALTKTVQPLFWAQGPRCSERLNMRNISQAVIYIPLSGP